MLRGVIALGHHLGEGRFVLTAGEADRERVEVVAEPPSHGHDATGIDATGKEGTQGDIRDQPLFRAGQKLHPKLIDRVLLRQLKVGDAGAPISRGLAPVLIPFQEQIMRRREAEDVLVDGGWVGNVAVCEEVLDGERVNIPRQFGNDVQRRHFGAEYEPSVPQRCIVERLLAQPVPRNEQRLLPAIPNREGEETVQPLHTGGTPGFPCMNDRLGVAVGPKDMSPGLKLSPQFPKVIDHTIEDDRNRHRLRCTLADVRTLDL